MKNYFKYSINKLKGLFQNNQDNKLFTLWISDDGVLPELQQLSLKSMILTGHEVKLYVYGELEHVPKGIDVIDGNKILDESNIFKYKEGFNKGSYSGFSNWFRSKCLYENGEAWFDTDILAIKNVNFGGNGQIIASQYNQDGAVNPLPAFMRLKKKDKLLKIMMDHMEEVKDNVVHGDTGPHLLKSSMDDFPKYYKYMMNPNFIASINFFDYMDFLKPSKDIVPLLNFDEIWGFHIWNAMFREYGFANEKSTSGFYHDLKETIMSSSSEKEYAEKIRTLLEFNKSI